MEKCSLKEEELLGSLNIMSSTQPLLLGYITFIGDNITPAPVEQDYVANRYIKLS